MQYDAYQIKCLLNVGITTKHLSVSRLPGYLLPILVDGTLLCPDEVDHTSTDLEHRSYDPISHSASSRPSNGSSGFTRTLLLPHRKNSIPTHFEWTGSPINQTQLLL